MGATRRLSIRETLRKRWHKDFYVVFFSVSRAISEPAVVYVEIEVSDCDEEIHFSDNLDGFSETQFVCSQAG